MSKRSSPSLRLPSAVVGELDAVEALAPAVGLGELVDWVNAVVEHYVPDAAAGGAAGSGRVSPGFTPRAIRHYQTLGCIDPPEKEGKEARYRFRHYLQALLIRKLLWERVPAERIRDLLEGRTNAEYKELLFRGIELVVRPAQGGGGRGRNDDAPSGDDVPAPAAWTRVAVAPGVEIHLREHTRRPKPADLATWLQAIERALRKHLR